MKNLILRVKNQSFQEARYLNKVIGTIDIKNTAKLINAVGLDANPRKSKVCNTTNQIIDTLKGSPGMLKFNSKGILVSTSSCNRMDKDRLNLEFANGSIEGILDGGHTTLACGLLILEMIDISDDKIKTLKTWDQFIDFWKNVFNDKSFKKIDEKLADNNLDNENTAQLPIEIIYPTEEGYIRFEENIYTISEARNNNTQLNETTKSNHRHYYDVLKARLDPKIKKKVLWKDNEDIGNNKPIKTQDIVALSLIPLLALQKANALHDDLKRISPIYLYNSKATCVQIYNDLISLEVPANEGIDLSYEEMNQKLESNKLLMSAFDLMKLIPLLHDFIYINFPKAFNANGKREFGKCEKVKIYSNDSNDKGKKFIKKKQFAQYYNEESEYQYPAGFYTPIIVSLSSLMHIKDNKLVWRVADPLKFLEQNLSVILEDYFSYMDTCNSDPQTLGKSPYSYKLIAKEIDLILS